MTEQQKRGGRRAGAGRKPTSNVSVTVRIAPRHRRLVRLAGSNLIEKALDLALNEGMSFDIDSRKLTLKERDQFLDGIKKVAKETEQPWWRPWTLGLKVLVNGSSPEAWGAFYGKDMQSTMDIVEGDYAHMAGQETMKKILVEKLNRFTRQELAEGVAIDAIIPIDRFFFYARAAYSKEEFPQDTSDDLIECFISDIAELSAMQMKQVESDDITKARKLYADLHV